MDDLIGCGVYYGSAPAEALRYRDEEIVVVGAANSAGQAALHLAGYARRVTMVVRGSSLEKSMSRYLTDRINASESIDVRLHSRVVRAEGDERLEALVIADTATGKGRAPAGRRALRPNWRRARSRRASLGGSAAMRRGS